MFVQSITALMIASLTIAQTSVPAPQVAPPPPQSASAPVGRLITVPTGTTIPLTLMSAVKSKSTTAGETMRAVVAFPVTIGTELAIPAGTFVEGQVIRVTARPPGGQQPSFLVHFTRLLFTNGYSVALNGENTQALLLPSENSAPANEVAELAPLQFPARFAMGGAQSTPTLPPLPRLGPNPAVVGGAIGGGFAALMVGLLIWAHHRVINTDFLLYDAGWQFQMILDSPVTLDATQIAAAAAIPSAN